jgi:butyryl-CoA dehydrogenase
MVYEMCRKFADEELAPYAGEWDKKHEFPREAVTKLVRVDTDESFITVVCV